MDSSTDNDVKLSRFYDSAKMWKYVRLYELYSELSVDSTIDETRRKSAVCARDHYRRMILCMAVKEIPSDFRCDDCIAVREVIDFFDSKKCKRK